MLEAKQANATSAAFTGDHRLDYGLFMKNAWRPTQRQDCYRITDVEGEIPRELHGTLYRNGPSQRIFPKQGYEALHLFDGDALVHAFRFDDGRLDYKGRFVESPSYLQEQAAGRVCMNLVGVVADDPAERMYLRQQHNTNIVYHGGKLMALVENAYPFEIHARDLGPIGANDFQGKMLGMSTTAHPKIDGRTGQMLIHGYQPFAPLVQLYVIEPDGRCSLAETVDAPFSSMMHDFAITEHHAVLPVCPITIDGTALMEGRGFAEAVKWEPDKGLHFGIRPRAAGGQVQWFTSPEVGYIFHPGNAYEDDGKIFMDACMYPDGDALLKALKLWRSGNHVGGFAAHPYLFEFHLGSGRCSATKLDDRGAEFPRIDDRRVGYKNRYGYASLNVSPKRDASRVWSSLIKYDRTGGASALHDLGPWQWPGEPVFVPRSAEAAEDDGFLLTVVYDGTSDGSYVAVLDARNFGAPPLARARLAHRIPLGFHGNFAAGVL